MPVVAGAGLARHLAIPAEAPLVLVVPQDVGDEIGLRRRQHVLGVRAGSLVHAVALAVVDAVDPAQVDALALVGEDLVALDVLEELDVAAADRGGEPGSSLLLMPI